MKEVKRITQFMLELYHLDALSKKERKYIEDALLTDNEVRLRYDELKKLDKEIKNKYSLIKPPVFSLIKNDNIDVYESKTLQRKKKLLWGICAAAIILCILIPPFIYFREINKNTDSFIAGEIYNNMEIHSIPENNIIITEEKSFTIPDKKKDIEIKNDNKPIIKNETVTVAVLPDSQQEVYTRGTAGSAGQNVNTVPAQSSIQENSNLNIPPGISFIFENMFANRQLTEIVIPQRITSIGKNAFADNPIVSVTIGANVSIDESSIPGNFANAYNNHGKAAGIYIRQDADSNVWSRNK
ncbi:MAG: leucine-rich repeat domain-containing protein [Treponema sp.]|nr:leucine-rich repeat domain-containing protein [Treponema sp.]